MATHEDASLILKLYELRREDKLRAAREWYAGKVPPQSLQDIADAMAGSTARICAWSSRTGKWRLRW